VTDYRGLSLWFDQLAVPPTAGAPLPGDRAVDVAIVGGGFTGLWTAYYLAGLDPTLKIAVLEREIAGFGASGRNGGWASALFPVHLSSLAEQAGRDAAIAQYRAMQGALDELIRVAAAERIDADIARGGTIVLARTPAQSQRARDDAREHADYGFDLDLLDADAARGRLNATGVLGGTYTPHCAAIQPARLVRGLVDAVRTRGVEVFERTPVTTIAPHAALTTRGTVAADVVVRATEAYTAQLPGHRRTLAPVYSLIIATEPLPESMWDEIGLRERETFSDYRNLIVYGQRSADGRMVFGGRGAPYHLGSRIRPEYDRDPAVFAALRQTIAEMFPVLRDVRVTHRWGGALGIARDWHASVGLDSETGVAWAGGYVGDGVTTAHLAGRTLADLITGRTTELTELPWVGHRSRNWEPEPLRWLGVNGGLRAMTWADDAEDRSGRPSRMASITNRLMGR